MAYKEKDTKKWTAQWFETNAKTKNLDEYAREDVMAIKEYNVY